MMFSFPKEATRFPHVVGDKRSSSRSRYSTSGQPDCHDCRPRDRWFNPLPESASGNRILLNGYPTSSGDVYGSTHIEIGIVIVEVKLQPIPIKVVEIKVCPSLKLPPSQ